MDLNDEAERALSELVDAEILSPTERRIARLMWLDGYKRGMEAVQAMAEDSFSKLQADFS